MAISEANLRYNAAERLATDNRVAKNCIAANLDRGADGGPLMGAEIVHDDDVTPGQGRHQELLDIGRESLAADRAVDHAWRRDGVVAQGGEEVLVVQYPCGTERQGAGHAGPGRRAWPCWS